MDWFNEPPDWSIQDHAIRVRSAPQTDFWRLTHSGVIRDTGHFYFQQQVGDFLAQVKLSGEYATLYDQAGMMVRVDEAHWMKCGIEFVDGVQQASAVVTRDYSDWSVVPLPQNPASLWPQVQRHASTIEVRYSLDGAHYQLLRQAYLAPVESMDVGLMCASPLGTGFSVTFEGWSIQTI